VACDFEDTFKCGYTTSTAGTVSWERVSGKTLSGSTGEEHGMLIALRLALRCLYCETIIIASDRRSDIKV